MSAKKKEVIFSEQSMYEFMLQDLQLRRELARLDKEHMEKGIGEIFYYCEFGFNFNNILNIEKFVADVLESNEPWLRFEKEDKSGDVIMKIDKRMNLRWITDTLAEDLQTDWYRYSMNVELFLGVFQSEQYASVDWSGIFHGAKARPEHHKFNKFIEDIRKEAKSLEFKKTFYAKTRLAKNNFISLQKYTNSLFERYSQLLIWRFEFSVSKFEDKIFNWQDERPHEVLDGFLRSWRGNRLFDQIIGYIWKLEFLPKKGYFFHFFLFISDVSRIQDIESGKKIGDAWLQITKGSGAYLDCKLSPADVKRSCIGVMSRDDESQRKNLRQCLCYFAEKDRYFQLRHPVKGRTIGHGEHK